MTASFAPRSEHLSELFGPTGSSQSRSILDSAIASLAAKGLSVPRRSRIQMARAALDDQRMMAALTRPGSRARRIVAEVQRISVEWWMISQSVPERTQMSPRLHALVQRAYGGELDPMTGSDRTARARDAQFELWLAAWLAMGGCEAAIAEPDIRTDVAGRDIGIAAKRVRSRRKIMARIEKAASQVKKHAQSGMIVVQLDNYSQRRRRSAATARSSRRFFDFYPELIKARQWLFDEAPWVCALVVFGTFASWKRRQPHPRLELASLIRYDLLPNTDSERAELHQYFAEHSRVYLARWRAMSGPAA